MKNRLGTLLGGILLPLCLLVVSATAWGQAAGPSLTVGESLYAGQYLTQPSGGRILEMQGDGNLVLSGSEVSLLLWQSGTAGHPGARYVMQGDGNLVVYDTNNVALWASGTANNPGSTNVMGADGNLLIYSPPRQVPLWASGTYGNPGATNKLEDGNLVIYSAGGSNLWQTGTGGHPGATNFLDYGNFGIVTAPQTNAVWASGTYGHPGAQFEFVNGSLVVVSTSGQVLWSTKTSWAFPPALNTWEFVDGELQVWGYLPNLLTRVRTALWRSGTTGITNGSLVMQGDGNLVIKSVSSMVLWQTGTGGHTNADLVMQQDGNLVVHSAPEPQVLWQSHTAGNPGAQVVMRPDGNLVILGPPTRKPIWASGTYGHPGAHVQMQTDGNLVIYGTNWTALWSSGTSGQPAAPHLDLQSDGNLVLYWQAGSTDPRWASGTFMPWMEKLGSVIAGFSLRELVIPGSHDSGTWGLDDRFWADDQNVSETIFDIDGYVPWHVEAHGQWVEHHTTWWPHIPYWTYDVTLTPHAQYMYSFARTQPYDFNAQLNNGIRYFDMRVLNDGDGLYLIHTLRGPSVFDEIDEINDYLRANPYEIVILDFQHFYTQGGDGSTIPDYWNRQLIEYIQHKFGDLLVPPPADVNQLTVGNVWASGKQVIVFYAQNPPSGVDTSLFWSRDNLLRSEWLDQQSLYSGGGKDGLANAINAEAACVINLQSGCGDAAGKLWVLQGILTFDPDTLENYAEDGDWSDLLTWLNGNRGAADSVNGWVQDWVLHGPYASKVNILLGDWASDSQLVKTAVAANLARAGLDALHPGIEGLPLFDSMPAGAPQTAEEATASTIPVVVPPSDLRLEATGLPTPVKLGASTAYDCIDGWLECQSDAAPSYPIGEHQIVWTAWDGAGVVGTATQTVWIVALRPQAETTNLWPANDKMVRVTIDANVVPALRGLVTLSASVASSDPQAGKGSDWTEPQIDQTSGTIRVELRAARQGGVDRLYAITVTATDAQGNADHDVVHVTVTAGLTLFADNFEDSHTDAPPNAPQAGSYGTATALVTTAAAHAGTKSAYLYPALGAGEMRPRFITPVPRDFKLHVETWLGCVAPPMHFGLDTAADNLFARVTLQPDGTITVFSGTNNVDTGLRYSVGTWEKYQIDYVVGSDKLVLTLNDQSVTATVPVQNKIHGLWFVCGLPGDNFQSRGFVDDVVAEAPVTPEIPPTLTYVCTGNQLTLSWIGTGYTLQENEAFPDPTGWKIIGVSSPTAVTLGAGNKFYRLNK
jgi:hypothetical protein